jgi:hypothetical protein
MYEVKGTAEIQYVKVGKVIPTKFKDRVKLFFKRIQSTDEGTQIYIKCRPARDELAIDSSTTPNLRS